MAGIWILLIVVGGGANNGVQGIVKMEEFSSQATCILAEKKFKELISDFRGPIRTACTPK